MNIRSVHKESALELRKRKYITGVLDELKPLLPNCSLIVMETEQREVIIKLLHKHVQTSCVGLKTKARKEQLLYSILLDQKEMLKLRLENRQHQFLLEYFEEH